MSTTPWWRIGWRNLGRHRKRTAITAFGLGSGYFAVVFLVGWSEGIVAEMVENATGLVSGQIEIHTSAYLPERSLYDTIGGREGVDVPRILEIVDAVPAVVAAAPRVYAGGLISSEESTSAGILMGIDPVREPRLSRFLDGLTSGRLPVSGRQEMLVGQNLAQQLAAGVGTEVVLVAPGADGSMGNDLFEIVGIFRTGLNEIDTNYGVLPLEDLQTLVVLDPGRIHEVAVATVDPWIAPETGARLSAALAPAGLDIDAPWTELRPEMTEYVGLAESFYFIIFLVVFAVAIFGVANTMLMATYERRREFAVLLALGTTPWSVVLVVLAEAAAMGSLALAAGCLVTYPLMFWFQTAPPDLGWLYGELTLFGALLRPTLRVEYNLAVSMWAGVALLVTALLAAVYPAIRASRIPPADTLSGL